MSQIKDKLPNGETVPPNGKRIYNKALKIDGYEEALKTVDNQKRVAGGTAPHDWPDTPEKLLERLDWMTPELAEEIKQAAGGSGVDFRLVSYTYASAKTTQVTKEVQKASTDAATKLADQAGLTGEERDLFIASQAANLANKALKTVGSGEKTPEEVVADIETYSQEQLGKASSFAHQSYLLVNSTEINKVLRKPSIYPAYKKVLVANVPGSSSNPLGAFTTDKQGYKILNFSTAQLSSLVPHIKLKKIILNGNKRQEVEIPFPIGSLEYSKTGKIFKQAGSDTGTYFKNRDGFGIRSFEWQLFGQNEATKFSDVAANLSLFFQDLGQLTAERVNSDGTTFRYLDLIVPRESFEGDKDADQNVFIVAEVGWSIPYGSGAFTQEQLAAIEENRVSLVLNQKNYEINFDSGTTSTFTLDIEYHSAYESISKNSKMNAILPEQQTCKEIFQKKTEIENLKEKIEKQNTPKESDKTALKKKQDEFEKIKDKAVRESYRHLFEQLKATGRLHYMKASLTQILNFQGVDPTIAATVTGKPSAPNSTTSLEADISKWEDAAADEEFTGEDIYFTYFGDVISIMMDNASNQSKLQELYGGKSKVPNFTQTLNLLTTNVGFDEGEVNIADIPIDVRLLANFFYTEIIAKKSLTISIHAFVKNLITKLMENKIEKFSESYSPSKRVYQTTFVDNDANITGLHSNLKGKLKKGTKYSYLAVYTVPKDGAEYAIKYPKDYGKSKAEDMKERAIYHFVFGSTNSVVSNVSFKKTDIEKLKEQRIFETQNPYAILANQFSVDIEMFGNTLFYPGRLVYINPAESLGGSGRPWQTGSVYQIMGLGGYHQIRKVTNVISDGVFKTSIEADFMASGSPPIKRRAAKKK